MLFGINGLFFFQHWWFVAFWLRIVPERRNDWSNLYVDKVFWERNRHPNWMSIEYPSLNKRAGYFQIFEFEIGELTNDWMSWERNDGDQIRKFADDDCNWRRDFWNEKKKKKEKKLKSRAGVLKRTYKVDELGLSTVSVARPYVSQPHLFAVIHTGDGDFALADVVVHVDVVHQSTILWMHEEDWKSFNNRIFFFRGKSGKHCNLI